MPSLPTCARLLVLITLSTAFAGGAQEADTDLWPGARYDSAIPTFEEVLGHPPGERIVSHAEALTYLRALVAAAPDRMKLTPYAKSWEGRELVWAVIGTPERLADLDGIQERIQRVADPSATDDAAAEQLIADLPATVWLAYAVHGNEISSVDAALFTAYHLLAAQGDPTVDKIRREALVFLDPMQNPDGRDRFVNNNRMNEGIEPDVSRFAAERDEPWPGGRTNHYYFDLNRDWFVLSQPETRGRVEILRQWLPLVFIDLHEMGADSTYYFAPEAVPYNPHLAADQRSSLQLIGRNNAKWFDEFGFDYFTREIYDAFFPGYGASWPAYYGAVAATYEMASARGLAVRRSDGTILTFRDGVRRHFVNSISTAEMAADNREKLWTEFRRYRTSAIEEGSAQETRTVVLPARGDVSAVDKLAGLLVAQGAEVERTQGELRACGETFPAGSYVISMAQPAKRFLSVLLDPDVPMEEEFLAEQERRRAKRLGDQIYDITAWSLPMMFGVDAVRCGTPVSEILAAGDFEPAGDQWIQPGTIDRTDAKVAYLVPWGSAAAGRLLTAALRQGLVALSPEKPFTLGGRTYPSGTLVFKVDANPDDLGPRMSELAASSGAEVIATDTSWVEGGINFGSRQSVKLQRPRVLMAWDAPTSSYSAGAARYFFERKFGFPVSTIRTDSLSFAELDRYQVLILPDTRSGYSDTLGERGRERLRSWVRSGGTLIAFGGAVDSLTEDAMDLLATAREARVPKEAGEDSSGDDRLITGDEHYEALLQPEEERPDSVPGVLARAVTDPDHWLTAGLPETLNVMVQGNAIYRPLTLDAGVNAVRLAAADELLLSGYLWEENRTQLAYKPIVMASAQGQGQVIAFAVDPFPRAFLDGLDVLVLNAVFRGPAHASPRW